MPPKGSAEAYLLDTKGVEADKQHDCKTLTGEAPAIKELAQIQSLGPDLQRFQVSDSYLMKIRDAGKTLQAIKNDTNNLGSIRNSLSEFQNLRNSLAHALC